MVFRLMQEIGDEGSLFIAKHRVWNVMADLWLRKRKLDFREDRILGWIFVRMRDEFCRLNMDRFLRFICERAISRAMDESDIIKLALAHLEAAMSVGEDSEHRMLRNESIDVHLATLFSLVSWSVGCRRCTNSQAVRCTRRHQIGFESPHVLSPGREVVPRGVLRGYS